MKDRRFVLFMLLVFMVYANGCAYLMDGTQQTVRIKTQPPGKMVYYQGDPVKDGQSITVRKRTKPPEVNVGTPENPSIAYMESNPNVWLAGDAGLLIFFLIPGVVAFIVDVNTGAWHDLEETQVMYVQNRD
ncbi:hypothetical protein JXA32_15200 [Candidatus Sumerlaeota bacterium]|nr:hypothetical protein [Candidatus Sumerlaeota bacterium]